MKLISRTLVLLTAAITLTGCLASTKYDKSTGDIRLRPVIGIGTRSGKEFIPFPEDRKFNVFAISQDTGRKFLDDVAVTYGGKRGWFPENTPKWPLDESLKFIGYYPSDLQMTCDSDGTLKMPAYTAGDIDLLVTDPTKAYNKNDSIAGLPFYHALAKIDFRAKHALNTGTRVRVEKIVIKGAYVQGAFDSSADLRWNPAGQQTDITVYAANGREEGIEIFNLVPKYVGSSMFIIPQKNMGSSIEVTYAFQTGESGWIGGQTVSAPVTLEAWEPDRHYTYTLSIFKDQEKELTYTTGMSSWDDTLKENEN